MRVLSPSEPPVRVPPSQVKPVPFAVVGVLRRLLPPVPAVTAVTVTVSATLPASRTTATGLTIPIFTATPVLTERLKPVASTVTVYAPGCRAATSKVPSPVVVIGGDVVPVASFFTVTVAPEMIPPLASVTVPLNVPVVA